MSPFFFLGALDNDWPVAVKVAVLVVGVAAFLWLSSRTAQSRDASAAACDRCGSPGHTTLDHGER